MTSFLKRILGEKTDDSPVVAANGNEQLRIEPLQVTDQDFDELIMQAGKPAVVDLWAEWCGPCHMIAPAVQDLAAEYDGRAVVAKLNVDENPNTPARYGIMGIPTLLFFKDGKLADQQVGVTGYPQLAQKLERRLD